MVNEEGTAPPPADAQAVPMLEERVRLLAGQSTGAALSTFLGAILIGVVLASAAPVWEVAIWIGAYLGPAALRVQFSRRVLRKEVAPDGAALRRFFHFSLFNGAWTGALPIFFFANLSVEARAALTVVSLLSLTAGLATFAPYRRGYLWVLGLALPPLILSWALFGGGGSWIVVVTLAVFGALMVKLSHHLADVFKKSVEIRFERERVVEALRREKEQTELAWHKAEEASRAKSRFLASASHDLRQPVHALGLFSAVLDVSAETQQLRAIASNISAVSDIIRKLLDNLLDISRLDAGIVKADAEPTSVSGMVERLAVETSRIMTGRPVEVAAHADSLSAVLDPVLVERCLRNLLDNACKFTTRGRIGIEAQRDGELLAFRVSDTGVGIPADQLDLVFEEFYQVGNPERDRGRGLGLGLSIVARLARLLGGEVRVQSIPGQGSCFTLRIPYVPVEEPVTDTEDAPPTIVDLSGHRVLVIDDEPLVRASMREQLRTWGAEVDEADGLEQARRMAARGRAPVWHLCLCDLRLRDDENGIRTAQTLRKDHPSLPVILVTGDTAPARIEQATRSGLPLLHKPVGSAQLARAIRAATGA
jgi:signal transduction histidine kinase/ActR/RegA family two-component response regulator